METKTIFYHTTQGGQELTCPEDGEVVFEDERDERVTLGAIITNELNQFGFRVWIFNRGKIFMIYTKMDNIAYRDQALRWLEQDFNAAKRWQ